MRFPKFVKKWNVFVFLELVLAQDRYQNLFTYLDIEFPVISHLHVWNRHMVKNLQYWISNIVSDFGYFISRVTASNLRSLCRHTGTWEEDATGRAQPCAGRGPSVPMGYVCSTNLWFHKILASKNLPPYLAINDLSLNILNLLTGHYYKIPCQSYISKERQV